MENICISKDENNHDINTLNECIICLNNIDKDNSIELSCCKSTEFCKKCIREWVIEHNKHSCPKCRSKTDFLNTCTHNGIEIHNLEYYIKIYNLDHPSIYFSSPNEMETRYISYMSGECRCSMCILAKYYMCMCSGCCSKLIKINILHKNDKELHIDEIFSIIDIMES